MSVQIIGEQWENQNGLSAYPFQQNPPIADVIVDASFIQYDNFIPTLNYILVSVDSVTLNVTFDQGTSNFVLTQSDYNSGLNYVRMTSGTRYIGRISLGEGVTNLWNTFVGQELLFGLPFVASTVRSIYSGCGLLSINGLIGTVTVGVGAGEENIFFNTSGNNITFNAVGHHKLPASPPAQALKLINLVAPIDNNIFISSSDVILINGNGIGNINISLTGSQPLSNLQPIASTLGF